MTAIDFHHVSAPAASRRGDLARIALVALLFANGWMGLAHLDPARPDTGTTQDWHGNVAASAPR